MTPIDPTDAEAAPGGWLLTLPCTRRHAEAIDFELDEMLGVLPSPPAVAFVERDVAAGNDGWEMQAYFERRPPGALVERIRALLETDARGKVSRFAAADWVSISQSGLPPISAGRFHVRNGEDDTQAPGHINFLIPASRAFGTGQHETTRGCLVMLDQLRVQGHRFGNIADIGTGTGILAFAALSLWPRAYAIASDLDPAAVGVTRENMEINGVPEGDGQGRLALVAAPGMDHALLMARAPYDLVIANILAGPLIALAPAFAAALADGGSLLLAGMLGTQAPDVLRACRRAGLRLAGRLDEGDWAILHLRRRPRVGWCRPERWRGNGGGVPGYGSW